MNLNSRHSVKPNYFEYLERQMAVFQKLRISPEEISGELSPDQVLERQSIAKIVSNQIKHKEPKSEPEPQIGQVWITRQADDSYPIGPLGPKLVVLRVVTAEVIRAMPVSEFWTFASDQDLIAFKGLPDLGFSSPHMIETWADIMIDQASLHKCLGMVSSELFREIQTLYTYHLEPVEGKARFISGLKPKSAEGPVLEKWEIQDPHYPGKTYKIIVGQMMLWDGDPRSEFHQMELQDLQYLQMAAVQKMLENEADCSVKEMEVENAARTNDPRLEFRKMELEDLNYLQMASKEQLADDAVQINGTEVYQGQALYQSQKPGSRIKILSYKTRVDIIHQTDGRKEPEVTIEQIGVAGVETEEVSNYPNCAIWKPEHKLDRSQRQNLDRKNLDLDLSSEFSKKPSSESVSLSWRSPIVEKIQGLSGEVKLTIKKRQIKPFGRVEVELLPKEGTLLEQFPALTVQLKIKRYKNNKVINNTPIVVKIDLEKGLSRYIDIPKIENKEKWEIYIPEPSPANKGDQEK